MPKQFAHLEHRWASVVKCGDLLILIIIRNKMFKVIFAAGLSLLAAAKEQWSHAEIHYGESSQIEGVSINWRKSLS